MFELVIGDICDILPYVRLGMIFGAAVLVIYLVYGVGKSQQLDFASMTICYIFAAYIFVVLEVTLLSREPGSRNMVDLVPLSTWRDDAQSRAYVIENVIMFIPFGTIAPLLWKRLQGFKWMLGIAFLASLVLETIQFITERGYFQSDDVIMNTAGAAIGLAVYTICSCIRSRLKS